VGPNALLRAINRLFCRHWHRLESEPPPLPSGGVILAGNHISGLDPLLVQASVDRPVAFMMAREYYQSMWYIRWGFDLVGAIPVNPGGANRQALRRAIEVVGAGGVLCIFPEGAANPPEPLARVLPGTALISAETGAPVIPFHISGVLPFDHRHMWPPFYHRSHARLRWGGIIERPGDSSRATLKAHSEEIRQRLLALQAAARR